MKLVKGNIKSAAIGRKFLEALRSRKKRKEAEMEVDPVAEPISEEPYQVTPQDKLSFAAANMYGLFRQQEPGVSQPYLLKEDDPLQREYIEEELFPNVGLYGADSTSVPWSAATVSTLAQAFDPTFEGSARHSDYIRRGFQGEDYLHGEGNYTAEKATKKTEYQSGDILFKGRRDEKGRPLGPQTYGQFEKDAKGKGKFGESRGYGSHSDIIVGTRTATEKDVESNLAKKVGEIIYEVQGGNMSNTLYNKEFTAKGLAKRYAGRLTQ
tara:strand:- start:706 stop:1506 length:801 start_codon:yes stop_codon:yes gene_type:complete